MSIGSRDKTAPRINVHFTDGSRLIIVFHFAHNTETRPAVPGPPQTTWVWQDQNSLSHAKAQECTYHVWLIQIAPSHRSHYDSLASLTLARLPPNFLLHSMI